MLDNIEAYPYTTPNSLAEAEVEILALRCRIHELNDLVGELQSKNDEANGNLVSETAANHAKDQMIAELQRKLTAEIHANEKMDLLVAELQGKLTAEVNANGAMDLLIAKMKSDLDQSRVWSVPPAVIA